MLSGTHSRVVARVLPSPCGRVHKLQQANRCLTIVRQVEMLNTVYVPTIVTIYRSLVPWSGSVCFRGQTGPLPAESHNARGPLKRFQGINRNGYCKETITDEYRFQCSRNLVSTCLFNSVSTRPLSSHSQFQLLIVLVAPRRKRFRFGLPVLILISIIFMLG